MKPPAQFELIESHGPPKIGELLPKFLHRELVSPLFNISTHTRPYVATAVNIISKHASNSKYIHWTAANLILRYLKKTSDH